MSIKALIVEDDINIAELLKIYLQKDGFETENAYDGKKAVELAEKFRPDIILLDIMLPLMDGWQVCREVRKNSQVPIIMLTAKGESMDKVSGLEMGADDYVTKPFDPKELIARVHAVMRRTDCGCTEEAERDTVALFHQIKGISLGAHVDGSNGGVPQNAQTSPACGHCVDAAFLGAVGRGNQYPILAYDPKCRFIKLFRYDFSEFCHDVLLFALCASIN